MTDEPRPESDDRGESETHDGDPLFADEDGDGIDDPFAELGGGVGVGDDDSDGDDRDRDRADPTPPSGPDSADPFDPFDPFDELGPTLDGDEDGAFGGSLDDAFDRIDSGETTDESVWDALDEDTNGSGETVGYGGSGFDPDSGADGPTTAAGRAASGDERVVDKRAYCQQCPHFSAPPDVACGHEGTTIAEAVGFSEFRVRNCPMVDDDAGLDAGPAFDDSE